MTTKKEIYCGCGDSFDEESKCWICAGNDEDAAREESKKQTALAIFKELQGNNAWYNGSCIHICEEAFERIKEKWTR